MSRVILLTKILIKTTLFSFSSKKSGNKSKGESTKWLGIIGYLLFTLIYGSLLVNGTKFLYNSLSPFGFERFILIGDAFIFCIAMIIFSIAQILSTFYFSKDIEYLLPLPFKPYEIIFAKFMVVLILEYLIGIIIFFPVVFTYGSLSSASIIFYLLSVIIFILLPIVPLIIITIILMIFMRYTNIGKKKDLIRLVGGIFIVIFGIFINIAVRTINYESLGSMDASVIENNMVYKVLKIVFYPATMAAKGLENPAENWLSIMIFLLCSIISIGVFYLASNALYIKGAIGGSDTFSKREKLDEKDLIKAAKSKSVVKTYIAKEIKILFRTPAFFTNCVLGSVMMPLIIVVAILFERNSINGAMSMIDSIKGQIIGSDKSAAMVMGIGFALIYFLVSTNMVAMSAISREGSNIFITKYIPISYKNQIYSKLFASLIVQGVSSFIYLLISMVLLRLPIYMTLAFVVFMLFSLFVGAGSSLIVDLIKPKLIWDNETKAVKNNFISVITTFVQMGISVFIGYLAIKFATSTSVVIASGIIIMAILSLIIAMIINKKAEVFFKKY